MIEALERAAHLAAFRVWRAGAAFRSLGDPLWDTSSPQGRLLSTLLAAIAEFERDPAERWQRNIGAGSGKPVSGKRLTHRLPLT
jgi:DNA invertase Pin-like site-specific DNA recombinase